jgi:hypothetical protein
MFYSSGFYSSIHIDQETVLNWFGIKDQNSQWSFSPIVENDYSVTLSGVEMEPSTMFL